VSDTIDYVESIDGIGPEHLHGFFVGWPSPPTPEQHVAILRGSDHVVLALEGKRVVGFVTAIGDGVLSAYIPLLEVLPDYRGRGIGRELMQRVLDHLQGLYMVDLCCDADLEPYYARLGFFALERGMRLRT
jgi:ribosomal protein S18 acetylase RimI-like enzyme